MCKFALKEITKIKGRIKFFHLVVDEINLFEEFEKQIMEEGNLQGQLNTIQARMQEIAEMKLLPKNKFREITPAKEKAKEYEIKTEDLRVYLMHEEKTGHIIIYSGQKNSQKKDIRKFRSLKKQYINSK
jgi:putative component of toxin-antitoxin plasmid stabilization module